MAANNIVVIYFLFQMGKDCHVRRCTIAKCIDKSHCNKGPAILTWLGSVTNSSLVANGKNLPHFILIIKLF